jgi:flagellar basal-body rod protein FlgF
MESGFYAALTGLVAKFDALDVAANNLANVNTAGYKAQEDFYRTYSTALGEQDLDPLNLAVNDYGVLGGATTNLQPGAIQSTGNPLDLALQGSGFFVVRTAAGDRYTRNGSFHTNAKGTLVSANNDPVMGIVPKKNGKPGEGPIALPNGNISISPEGAVSVNGTLVGQLKLVDFPRGTPLTLDGNNMYAAPASAAQPAASPQVKEGALESSNVNPMSEMVSLTMLQQETGMLQNAISTFDKDFDQTAINEIPSVQ